jgi:hypothetical protein
MISADGGRSAVTRKRIIESMSGIFYHYLGSSSGVTSPRGIRILADSCFHETEVQSMEFEFRSAVARIGASAFPTSSMNEICIPRTIGILKKQSFAIGLNETCATIDLSSEPDS